MFVGTFPLALDDKGRVILPVKFRDALKDGAYVTKSLDGCLAIYTAEDFEAYASELKDKVRRGSVERTAVRALLAGGAPGAPPPPGAPTHPPPRPGSPPPRRTGGGARLLHPHQVLEPPEGA